VSATVTLAPQDLLLRAVGLTEGIQEVPTGSNGGRAVERILRRTGNRKGEPWCASYVADVGYQLFGHDWPLPNTASCDRLLESARRNGVLVEKPVAGAVFLLMKTPRDAIHTGFVTEVLDDGWRTIEGNTNDDGGRDGWGVLRRTRGQKDDPSFAASLWYTYVEWWRLM
jgi:hypothetical protein